jgi:hypothetical protein
MNDSVEAIQAQSRKSCIQPLFLSIKPNFLIIYFINSIIQYLKITKFSLGRILLDKHLKSFTSQIQNFMILIQKDSYQNNKNKFKG